MSYKFSVGEIAILAYSRFQELEAFKGEECQIISLPKPEFYRAPNGKYTLPGEYTIQLKGEIYSCLERQLRKRPDDQPFSEWFRNTIITDLTDAPLETTMRNVARNLQKFTEAGHGS